ncbi:MAG: hypothetical protein ACM3YN_08000 [Parcubacteria group bacterium]
MIRGQSAGEILMDPVSNVDGLVLLLRQRLLERSRTSASSQKDRKAGGRADAGVASVQALAAVDDLDDRQLKRALIQNILAEQLGRGLLNEARFQQVVDRVTDTIELDADASKLLSRLIGDLRVAAR